MARSGSGMRGVGLEPDDGPVAVALRTGRPARNDDFSQASGVYGDAVRRMGIRSSVAAPIVVEGRLWGALSVGTRRERFPADTEQRLAGFTELVGTAIANADSRAQLTASRARIVAAADDARRRIERDLHDGTQQRLIALGLTLRLAQSTVPAQLPQLETRIDRIADELTGAIDELREIARGIHPAILSQGGLAPALRTLARRAAIPVKLHLRTPTRPPDRIEVAAYYVVSEALTNTTRHAHATRANVAVEQDDARLHLSIHDDGVGGADPTAGSGLVGLRDRVQALGGTLDVTSPRAKARRSSSSFRCNPTDRSACPAMRGRCRGSALARLRFYERIAAQSGPHRTWSGESLDRVMAHGKTTGMALLRATAPTIVAAVLAAGGLLAIMLAGHPLDTRLHHPARRRRDGERPVSAAEAWTAARQADERLAAADGGEPCRAPFPARHLRPRGPDHRFLHPKGG